MSSKKPKIYFIAPNGAKIEIKSFTGAKLTSIEVIEPRIDAALTNELNAKGSVDVTFKYDEVSK